MAHRTGWERRRAGRPAARMQAARTDRIGKHMTLGSFWIAIAAFAVLAFAFYALTLRYGPRRGTWNQPAAALRRPGWKLGTVLYATGVAHGVTGIWAAGAVPGPVEPGVALIGIAMCLFYVSCAHVMSIARLRRPTGGAATTGSAA